MLQTTFNICWPQHVIKTQLYGGMNEVTDRIWERRLIFAGHCYWGNDEMASRTILWQSAHGRGSQGSFSSYLLSSVKRWAEQVNDVLDRPSPIPLVALDEVTKHPIIHKLEARPKTHLSGKYVVRKYND